MCCSFTCTGETQSLSSGLRQPFCSSLYEYTQGFVETERRSSDSEKETLQLILKGCVAVSEMDWSIWGKAFFLLSQPRQAKFKVPKEWPEIIKYLRIGTQRERKLRDKLHHLTTLSGAALCRQRPVLFQSFSVCFSKVLYCFLYLIAVTSFDVY